MVGIAVQERNPKAAIGRLGEERSQAERRRFGEVLVGIAKTAVDLEGNVELAAFQRCLEEQGMAQHTAGKTWVLAALGAQPRCTEGDTQDVGIHRLQLEGRAVGADGFDANGAASDAGPQFGADGAEPFARVAGAGNEALSDRLQPDDLSLRDPEGLLLLRQGEGLGGDKAVVDEHDGGGGAGPKTPGGGGPRGGGA